MAKDKILFIYRNKGLAKKFVEHLIINNYDVYEFYTDEIPEHKLTFFQKIENIFHRTILKNTKQLHEIYERNFISHSRKELLSLKRKNEKFDYCLVIRGDLVPEFVMKYARTVSHKMVDYQLDGLSVSSKILDYQEYFDDIFVFDKNDIKNYPNVGLKHISNCYFDDENKVIKNIDFLYIGVNTEKRKKYLTNIFNFLQHYNQNFNFNFSLTQNQFRKESPISGITFLDEPIPYDNCLKLAQNTRCVIDIKREEHDGLSLRFFEALVYKNKIITNNTSVLNYDFYNPNNIFITDFKNFDGLMDFLKSPYQDLDKKIINKYNFKYWIKKLLNSNL